MDKVRDEAQAALDALKDEHQEAKRLLFEMLEAFKWVRDHDALKEQVEEFLMRHHATAIR